ncbi:hypothetical protein [Bradyrhizobium oligotrophicum]|uniref:hypothetical protein n=1 Tax=Bradyrhizobium oligotrophicum TaxID=44255 RepID=UPI003EBD1BD8
MAKVRVYRASSYDIQTDQMIQSRRWFTEAGAAVADVQIEAGQSIEVDETDVQDGWWTAIDYRPPHPTGGYQTQVKNQPDPY